MYSKNGMANSNFAVQPAEVSKQERKYVRKKVTALSKWSSHN